MIPRIREGPYGVGAAAGQRFIQVLVTPYLGQLRLLLVFLPDRVIGFPDADERNDLGLRLAQKAARVSVGETSQQDAQRLGCGGPISCVRARREEREREDQKESGEFHGVAWGT